MNIQSDINTNIKKDKIEIDTNDGHTKGFPNLTINYLVFKGKVLNKDEKEIKEKETEIKDNQIFENDYEINYLIKELFLNIIYL